MPFLMIARKRHARGGLRRRAGQWREWERQWANYRSRCIAAQREHLIERAIEDGRLVPTCPDCGALVTGCEDPLCEGAHHVGFEWDEGSDCCNEIPWFEVVRVSPDRLRNGQ